MKMDRFLKIFSSLSFFSLCIYSSLYAVEPIDEENPHTHPDVSRIATEDPELKDQIVKIQEALNSLHPEMVQRRQALKQETNETRRAILYAELDGLRKEHDQLERLLHDLVDEAIATEWTKIDAALKRAKKFELQQEQSYEKEEAIRDRQS